MGFAQGRRAGRVLLLHLVLSGCWILTSGIVLLVAGIAARRRLQRWRYERVDRWRAEMESELPCWVAAGWPPRAWRNDPVRRQLLLDSLVSRIELEGRSCTRSGSCSLVAPGAALPCAGEGRPCQGPGFFRALVEQWGLVEEQIALVRRLQGLERAQAVILLGRLRAPRSISVLADLLDDPDGDVRLAAVRALGLVGTPAAARPLLDLLQQLELPVSIPSVQRALMNCCEKQPHILLLVLERLKGRRQAVLMRVLAELVTPGMLPALERMAGAEEPQTRAEVARALERLSVADSIPLLIQLANDRVWYVRVRAVRSLARAGGWATADVVLEALNSDYPEVRQAAAESLAQQPLPLDELIRKARLRLTPQAWRVFLGELGRQGLVWTLAEQLASPVEAVRRIARQWLREALAAGAHKTLLDALAHPDPVVADAVADFLGCWGDNSLRAELDELAEKTSVGSPLHGRLIRVRNHIGLRVGS